MTRGLADTSIFIAREARHPIDEALVPTDLAVSVITIGELRSGVLHASGVRIRSERLASFESALRLGPLPIDEGVATAWGDLRSLLREAGRRMPVNDSWIAATAMAHGIPVVTQDQDYLALPGLEVIHV